VEINKISDDITVFENIIPVEYVDYLNKKFLSNSTEEDWPKFPSSDPNYGGHWDYRIFDLKKKASSEDSSFIKKTENEILNQIKIFLGKDYTTSDGLEMVMRALPGQSMDVHTDNHSEKCKYGIVFYYNDDYEGGEIFYPDFDLIVKPKKRSVVVHGATIKHGVKEVINGIRYYSTSFFFDGDLP
jgi:hypothetical protein